MSKKTVTPKLRFPEFVESGEWEVKHLIDVCGKITQGGTPDTSNPDYWNGSIEWLTPAEMGNIETRFIDSTSRKITEEGLRNCSSDLLPINSVIISTRAPIGHLAINRSLMAINQGCKALIPNESTNYNFLYYSLLNSKPFLVDLGAGNTFKELSGSSLKNFEAPFPELSEQQKIADCLSALDELLTAERARLEALKAYKKGLLQNLFPAEGESVPALRFPEFQSAGEWEERKFGQISKNITAGGTPNTSKSDYWNGNIRWMNSGELNYKKVYEVQGRITEKGLQNSSTRLIPIHCVLIGLAGQGRTRGTVAMNMIELCTNQSIAAIFPNEEIFNSNFLYHNLDSRYDELRRISTGGEGRGGLNLQIIKSLKIKLPSLPEQQKIAACLSALDEEITSQSQRVAGLAVHKKGLLQGLFPSAGETSEVSKTSEV